MCAVMFITWDAFLQFSNEIFARPKREKFLQFIEFIIYQCFSIKTKFIKIRINVIFLCLSKTEDI
jgi:hypothetical protein